MRRKSFWFGQSMLSLAVLGAAALAFSSIGVAQDATRSARVSAERTEQQGPAVIAIKFHADWCGYCKAMGSVFEELQAKYDQQPVLFVTFDQTRSYKAQQSKYLAHAMDLQDVWNRHGGKTGFVLLIDAETNDVVERLDHQQSLKDMGAALQRAVRSAS